MLLYPPQTHNNATDQDRCKNIQKKIETPKEVVSAGHYFHYLHLKIRKMKTHNVPFHYTQGL